MREIKFRARYSLESFSDKLEKGFVYFTLGDKFDGNLLVSKGVYVAFSTAQEYINQRDMNNKEIYEGDIANYEGVIGWGNHLIEWKEHGFYYMNFPLTKENIKGLKIEITGNNCENPELLEEK